MNDFDDMGGTFYELSLKLPGGSDDPLQKAIRRLWAHEQLNGPYVARTGKNGDRRWQRIRAEDRRLEPLLSQAECEAGFARLPMGVCACCVGTVRDPSAAGGADWLNLSIPSNHLETVVPLRWPPGGSGNRSWREPLDRWFADVASWVREVVTFELALIGEEVSGGDDLLSWHLSRGHRPFAHVVGAEYVPAEY